MKSFVIVLVVLVATASGDVSHLVNHYLPPNQYHHQNSLQNHYDAHGSPIKMTQISKPSNERVETTIEKHEVIELPTQIEIVKDGQPIYGVVPPLMEMPLNNKDSNYLSTIQKIENLQPPQVPYEMPMRTYLPSVSTDTTTRSTDMPNTTTMMPPTTTDVVQMMETTTLNSDVATTTVQNMLTFDSTTTNEIPTTEQQITYYSTTLPTPIKNVTMQENHYLPPPLVMEAQNQYLPPSPMMLPPYQEYQKQMKLEQIQQQQHLKNEMQEMLEAIAEMEQKQMIALDDQQKLQIQPIAPVEPAHILLKDGYHYKIADNNLRRGYRYRY